jgi:pyrroloquinoline-quinone synthase
MSIHQMRATARRHDLLLHSFYQRWTRGELSLDELQDYACQYSLVVRAMPRWLDQMAAASDAPDELRTHAREEAAHVEMWADFAGALGIDRAALEATRPNQATERLLETGDDLVGRGDGAAALWALEAQTPAVSVEKLKGLREHYGIQGSGARYFEVHRTMDVRHTAELEELVAARPAVDSAAPEAADAMGTRLWDLLTSVEREVVSA